MGSSPTLDHPPDQQEATTPTADRASPLAAEQAFARLNPSPGMPQDPLDSTRRTDMRDQQDVATRGYRVAHADWTESDLPGHQAIQQLRDRAQLPQPDPEYTFDRLNPAFGVPADIRDPLGQQAVRDREVALALGTRVVVATSRENDRAPATWLSGQDYRAADAIRHARAHTVRTRQPVERAHAGANDDHQPHRGAGRQPRR